MKKNLMFALGLVALFALAGCSGNSPEEDSTQLWPAGDDNGKYGYMSNPNAKYDWYSEGGRWSGYLTNKEGNTTNCELLTEVDWDKTDTPFCFVNANGEWIERGQMGWFAMVANEKKKDVWNEEFKAYVQSLLNDEQASEIEVYAIDYHI